MLSAAERLESDRRVEAQCAEFEVLSWEIVYSGLAVPPDIMTNAFLVLRHNEGQRWKKQAYEMNAADVIEYIDHKFGPLYVGFLHAHFNLTVH